MRVGSSGCPEAAAELFDHHHSWLVGYARTRTREPADAEDLAAVAFARTHEQILHGLVPQSLRAYLAATVRHLSVDEYRRAGRLRSLDHHHHSHGHGHRDDQSRGPASAVPALIAPDIAAVVAESDLLRQAFAILSARHRLVLWRTAVEGRDLADVATEFGIKINAAAALAHRARHALRAAYKTVQGQEESAKPSPVN